MAYDRTIPMAADTARAERLGGWARRKPRVALMGEFSAGKSTLLNFLIEEELLPTRATATEVPPVWFSHGDGDSYWVDEHGTRRPVAVEDIAGVPMSARYVRVFVRAEILEHCDIVDTPGISDPNLAAESWRFAAGISNLVLWCSSATQAWRETERSAWLSLPERLRKHSIVVVTRADKLQTAVDRDKVRRRLVRETVGLFHDTVFMATPDAVRAKAELARGESSERWESSGAAALLDRLAERFQAIADDRATLLRRHLTGFDEVAAAPVAEPVAEVDAAPAGPRPVRVQVGSPRRTERLRSEDADAVLARLRVEAEAARPEAADGPLVLRNGIVGGEPAAAPLAGTAAAPVPAPPDAEAHQSRPGYAMWFGGREAGHAADEAVGTSRADEATDPVGATAPQAPVDASAGVAPSDRGADPVSADDAGLEPAAADAGEPERETEDDAALAPDLPPFPTPFEAAGAADLTGAAMAGSRAGTAGEIEDGAAAAPDTAASDPVPDTDEEDAFLVAALLGSSLLHAAAEPFPATADAEAVPGPRAAEDPTLAAIFTSLDAAEFDRTPDADLPAAEPPEDQAAPGPAAGYQSEAAAPDAPAARPAAVGTDPVAPAAAAADAPAAVLAWRAIVSRTELLPGNAQIVAMIDELLATLYRQEAAPADAPAAAAAARAPEANGPADADEAGPRTEETAEASFAGWRRLA